ncbi:MAG: NADH:ubiquinone reductase (Na(+)-transporting) subunit A [Pseudomonadota bacterium]
MFLEVAAIRIALNKGLDIRLAGAPQQSLRPAGRVRQVALLGGDYAGLKPRLKVEVGQSVGLGETLFVDKRDPDVCYPSPGSGRVVEINRGRRRVLQSVVVALDSGAAPEASFDVSKKCDPAAIRQVLCRSGAWTGFRTRPYDRVALSTSSPRSVFVTATDTRPLAPDPKVVIAARRREFEVGMLIVSRLGDWPVYLCTGADWSGPDIEYERVRQVEFSGPHPAGLPGTHIHHLAPVAGDRSVWHIGYQDVIAIGHLFETGRLLTERVVSLAGSGIAKPGLVQTRLGAGIADLTDGEMLSGADCVVLSGSALDGVAAEHKLAYLGRYHNQVSVIAKTPPRRPPGFIARALKNRQLSKFAPGRNGPLAPMVPVGAFDRVMPLDVLPVPLLRALLVKDTDAAQALGCLDLAEEDLALCSFVCPAKQDYGAALRLNLDQIEREG